MERHHTEVLTRIARETGRDLPSPKKHAAGDPAAARGVPIAGFKGGFGGTAPGTQPERELLRREGRRGE